jgi:chromosome condensin MukBEF ATPase and DNA-binding subunit MukB
MNKVYITITILFLTSTLFANASTSNSTSSELVTIVKQQQALAKQVSKYYVDFQADQKNFKKKQKMKNTIYNFNKNHLKLIKHRSNTKLINQKLTKVDKIWKIAHKLSETKKHSAMLKTAMNDISGKMKELRKLYKNTSH